MTVEMRFALSSAEGIIDGLKGEAGWAAAFGLATVLICFLKNPAKVEHWASMIVGLFEKISSRSARHSTAADIRGKLAAFVKSAHMDSLMPYGLKIKWIVKGDDELYADKSDIVVVMKYRRSNDRNFVTAARQYTSKALLPGIRYDLPDLCGAGEEGVCAFRLWRRMRAPLRRAWAGRIASAARGFASPRDNMRRPGCRRRCAKVGTLWQGEGAAAVGVMRPLEMAWHADLVLPFDGWRPIAHGDGAPRGTVAFGAVKYAAAAIAVDVLRRRGGPVCPPRS